MGAARARPRRRAAAPHPRRRAERARAARARPAVVARAGRARPPLGGGHASRRPSHALDARGRDEPRRRHPPRRPRVRARLLPLQRRRLHARAAARGAASPQRALVVDCDVHQGDGTADLLGADPRRVHALAARRAQLPVPAHPVRPRRRPADGHRRRRLPRGARPRARRGAGPLAARDRVLPRRRRPVGGRPPRPPRAHQGRACAPATSSCSTGCARPARTSASCSPAATRRTCATPSRSTPRPPRRSPPAMEARGIEPLPQPCKGRVLPLSLRPRRGRQG